MPLLVAVIMKSSTTQSIKNIHIPLNLPHDYKMIILQR